MIRTLRARLFLLALLTLAPAIAIILYTAMQQQKVVTETTQAQAKHLAQLISEKHKDLISKTQSLLQALGDQSTLRKPSAQCNKVLSDLVKTFPYYANIGIMNEKGHAYCSAVPITGSVDLSFRSYYQRAVQTGQFSAGDYQVGKITGKASINFGYPIYDKNHKLIAVLYAALDLGWLNKIFMGKSIPENFIFLITDQNGVVLVKHPEDGTWVGKSILSSPLFAEIKKNENGIFQSDEFDKTSRVFAYSPLDKESMPQNHLYFALGLSNASLIAAANPVIGKNFFILLLALLLTFAMIWFLSYKLVLQNLESVLVAIKKFRSGDLNARTGVSTAQDEISRLAVEFDEMASSLQAQIQKRESAENELRTALVSADSANRAKSDFVAHMSHEIRTPIGAILGFSELLRENAHQSSEIQQYAQTVQRNASHLLHLVDGILDLSKMEAGVWDTNRQTFSLVSELEFLHRIASAQATSKSLTFKTTLVGSIPEHIHTDQVRLHQILTNLITNAIKFTDAGLIEFSVRFLPATTEAPRPRIEFSVRDTGKGLTPLQMERLFQPFVQGDSAMSRKHGGAGLGLFLTKRFAKALGGDAELVSSVLGVGSEFRVIIETGSVENVKWVGETDLFKSSLVSGSNHTDSLPLKDLSILVIEDTLDNQFLLNRLLTAKGAKIEIADDAEIGIVKILNNDYDVILMDIQLPGMSGLDATRHLRSLNYQSPIIALTAHAMKGEREKCLAAGCDEYSTKPVNVNELVNMILKLKNRPNQTPRRTDLKIE